MFATSIRNKGLQYRRAFSISTQKIKNLTVIKHDPLNKDSIFNTPVIQDLINLTKKKVQKQNTILCFLGAGASNDSARAMIRPYRDSSPTGKNETSPFNQYPQIPIQHLQDPNAPRDTWITYYKFNIEMLKIFSNAHPTLTHYEVNSLSKLNPNLHVVTSNIDGLCNGIDTKQLTEIHGNAFYMHCIDEKCNDHKTLIPALPWLDSIKEQPIPIDEFEPPNCSCCGKHLRFSWTMFGEELNPNLLNHTNAITRNASIGFFMGTSLRVHPIKEQPHLLPETATKVFIGHESPSKPPPNSICIKTNIESFFPEFSKRVRETD